ncbi:hypothetical protein A2422_00160 [Candidatus Woesebacteria bacterium RIFOXYC1_FULL_31_51]|uniref:Twin-arginine translocation signal domain-containing protein n=1 Tax=Candidatus Woesebacteria bacterium GW2011_GWC2_31_9 TaxID=1618586 RepID=A0A0F9YWN1_9BACT|nr:MAG: hypothetical protein UR17_C0001G0455 [Candidatus Woesebacteria bacterium GW2011_GWF1_31_35]KKP23073.1 MAG: hypothetical protein UR11_C0001G0047 [Candidatus Woesebacteria bacterium GW2011_GWC1_30_29]KKP25108.1 MAG: hypothetical protein UR13_C0012G0006 [Candidatus Woesebacteria bacterium GW2011_GWD1_31_12]KKP27315.1 MAG: hypothetical protein UR16_C0004G0047 [Candidatus Woesebacteria bacterium GW2011_GWB1_31_29]KKP30886.1 MAG: hypothetical protein UR21_C0021G0002 [Candidatus Woesebacteria 
MSKELNRRDFLKGAVALTGASILGAFVKIEGVSARGEEPKVEVSNKDIDGIKLSGIPEVVDSNVVDVAKGVFRNETGVAPHIYAEPGALHVGPDFGYTGTKNPYGVNNKGWEAMYESGGTIQPFSPVTQEIIRWPGEAHQNVPEGGFVFFTGGQMKVEIGDIAVDMPYKPAHNYFFVARGIYTDGKQDSDLNRTAKITNYKPGHLQVRMYPSALKSNLAFISEGQFLQEAVTSHITGTNCGAEGASKLTVVAIDINTGATQILRHEQLRSTDLNEALKSTKKNWNKLYSNF